ncbi:kinase-like domain-containing protein [Camillea tinctor]|nr:kinase-like domain-containing protein [Camillea tinctor]
MDQQSPESMEQILSHHLRSNIDDQPYLPAVEIRKLLDKRTITRDLRKIRTRTIDTILKDHVIVLAVLTMVSRQTEIVEFMRHIRDSALPLEGNLKENRISTFSLNNGAGRTELRCFDNWATFVKEGFMTWQWAFNVPHLSLKDGKARDYKFDNRHVLPWCDAGINEPEETPESSSDSSRQANEGAFGEVTPIGIDPQCDGFGETFKELGLTKRIYALKVLKSRPFTEAAYEREASQLKRFNGKINPHLVTLLASYTFKGYAHFLFPWADSNLSTFWKTSQPERNPSFVRWLADQFLGITRAVLTIHEPDHLKEDSPLYGRHGDIKPDNILCYTVKGCDYKRLVVADFGLSSIHHEATRTYVPDTRKPVTPGYRPPESDTIVSNCQISRNYDIWTLGCLFMEILVWYLGNNEMLLKFQHDRISQYIVGNLNIFYAIYAKKDHTDGYPADPNVVIQVKPQVVKYYEKIYEHKDCSRFIRDVCKAIEDHMLLVVAPREKGGEKRDEEEEKRIMAVDLVKRFELIKERCEKDSYCLDRLEGVVKPSFKPGVEFTLTEEACDVITRYKTKLPVYQPPQESV